MKKIEAIMSSLITQILFLIIPLLVIDWKTPQTIDYILMGIALILALSILFSIITAIIKRKL